MGQVAITRAGIPIKTINRKDNEAESLANKNVL